MSKRTIFMVVLLAVFVVLSLVGYFYYQKIYLPNKVDLPSPFLNFEFPAEKIEYPGDWPDYLIFPSDFTLVGTASGTLLDGEFPGWSAKYRYKGSPSEALETVSQFITNNGWSISESYNLNKEGSTLLIECSPGEGIISLDIDPDNSSQVLMVITFFPKY